MKLVAVESTALTVTELAELAKDGPVILTRKGKPLAAIKPLRGKDWESIALANNPEFQAIIERSRQSYRERGGTTLEEVRKEFGLPAKPGKPNRSKRKRSNHTK